MSGFKQRLKIMSHQLSRLDYNNLNTNSAHVSLTIFSTGENWVSHEKFFFFYIN